MNKDSKNKPDANEDTPDPQDVIRARKQHLDAASAVFLDQFKDGDESAPDRWCALSVEYGGDPDDTPDWVKDHYVGLAKDLAGRTGPRTRGPKPYKERANERWVQRMYPILVRKARAAMKANGNKALGKSTHKDGDDKIVPISGNDFYTYESHIDERQRMRETYVISKDPNDKPKMVNHAIAIVNNSGQPRDEFKIAIGHHFGIFKVKPGKPLYPCELKLGGCIYLPVKRDNDIALSDDEPVDALRIRVDRITKPTREQLEEEQLEEERQEKKWLEEDRLKKDK